MSNRDRTGTVVALALQQRAASVTVTPAAAAERVFRQRSADRRRRPGLLVAAAVALVLLVLAVAGLVVGTWQRESTKVPPAGPPERVTTRSLDPSAADATAHLAGNGAVVDDRMWFIRDDASLVTAGLDGVQISSGQLPEGTDGELLCCLVSAGDVVLVPTPAGYSHRDATSGQQLATTPSAVAGPAAVADTGVWLRTGVDRVALVQPGTGRVVRSLTTPGSADVLAAAGDGLFVASRTTFDVRRVDAGSGRAGPAVRLRSAPGALAASGAVVAVADAGGRLTVLDAGTGRVLRRYDVDARSTGPVPRLVATPDALWWSPDAGTVVRLSRDGVLRDAVAVALDRVWDNDLQQRNGLYVTPLGLWVPTRNDGDDFEYHRLPLTLRQP